MDMKGNKERNSLIRENNKFKWEFKVDEDVHINHNTSTTAKKRQKKETKSKYRKDVKIKLSMASTLPVWNTLMWTILILISGYVGLKAETEVCVLAAHDHCLLTRNYQTDIYTYCVTPKCRFGVEYPETIDRLGSGCTLLSITEYRKKIVMTWWVNICIGKNMKLLREGVCNELEQILSRPGYRHKIYDNSMGI